MQGAAVVQGAAAGRLHCRGGRVVAVQRPCSAAQHGEQQTGAARQQQRGGFDTQRRQNCFSAVAAQRIGRRGRSNGFDSSAAPPLASATGPLRLCGHCISLPLLQLIHPMPLAHTVLAALRVWRCCTPGMPLPGANHVVAHVAYLTVVA